MARDPEDYRDVKLLAAENGGFILEYDEMGRPEGQPLASRTFLGTRREVFGPDDGQKALTRLMIFSGVIQKPAVEAPTMSAHADE